jgi:bacterioferritin (cytochrome b1)
MTAVFKRIDEMRNIYENLSKLTDSVHNLTVTMSIFGEQMKDTKEDLLDVKKDLDVIKSVPIDEYRDIKRMVVGAVIGAIVTTIVVGVMEVI